MNRAVGGVEEGSQSCNLSVLDKEVWCGKFLRIDPDGRLETNSESTLEDKQHSCSCNTRGMCRSGIVLDLVDQTCLDGHSSSHDADHRQELLKLA
jgi:hypothetical protein